jgi:hypothetical protein
MSKEIEVMVKDYVTCRDYLKVKHDAFKKEEKQIKAAMENIAAELMEQANKQGVESFKTKSGTAFKKVGFRIEVEDWPEALKYIIENDLGHILTKSVGKVAAKEFMDANKNQLPPGLKYRPSVEIQVRRK